MDASVARAFVSGFVPIFTVQCLIGLLNWTLALKGRRTQKETARVKAKIVELDEKSEREINSLHASLDAMAAAMEAFRSGGDFRRELNARGAEVDQAAARPPRLGIALCGGGAKGAYQVGVLRILRASGVRPDVIAGTSVGAINATLLSLDDIEVAADFWSAVSFWQVARVGLANLAAVPLLLFALLTAGSSDDIDGSTRRQILIGYYATILPLNAAGVLFMGWPWLAVAANLLACTGVVTLGYLADSLVGLLGLALLSNAPLAATIQAKVPPGRLRATGTPLYVTVAARRRIIDPINPWWVDRRKRVLRARQPYVPEYRRLQEETDADIQRLVLQSAAIPFGVFPLRRVGDSGYVDGGIADNVPIQPLIDAGCTCIVVIHLDENAECDGWRLTDEGDLWARLGQLRELRRLAVLGREHTLEDLTQQAQEREASPDLREEERSANLRLDYMRANVTFVHIVPSKPLGNFATGTMNFSARNARDLIELGEHDARIKLERSPDLAAWTSQTRLSRIERSS